MTKIRPEYMYLETTSYSEKYDAYYNLETGEWLSPKCGDITCEFCSNRPDRFEN